MATISGKELKSLYQQLSALGYNYADIVSLAKQYDVTEAELNQALKDENAQIGYEAPDDKEKAEFERIRKDVESNQTEKTMEDKQALELVKNIQNAGYTKDQIYNLASQYDVSPQEIDALLGGTAKNISYRDPTAQERAQFESIAASNVPAKAVADYIYTQQKNSPPPEDYQGTLKGGSGVDFKGSSGLREFFGPYVTDYLSRMSGLLGLRDAENYTPTKFGTAAQGGTYGGDTAKILADLQTQREKMMGMGEGNQPMYQPYQYSFAPKPAAAGGVMSLVEKYQEGGDVGNQPAQPSQPFTGQYVPSTYTSPTNTTFDAAQQETYMSPYMSGVVDPQIREAKRRSELMGMTNAAKATQAGVFGGTRNVLMDAENQRNLNQQLGDIFGAGQQKAFENAQQQFNIEQNRGLQVAQTSAQYDQLARELQQKAEEAQARGDQFAASLALQQLQDANQYAERTRAFEYQQARDTYLDPFRELGYASQLLQGLPISASTTGISPSANALKALLASAGVLFPDETGG